MSIPLTDAKVKRIIEYTLQLIQSDPDRHLPDVFGDLLLEPLEGLYGNRVIDQIKGWLRTTKVTVITGFDLSQAELPAVTVNMGASTTAMKFLGDHGGQRFQDLTPGEREVVVPAFGPADFQVAADRMSATLTPPPSMPQSQSQLILPGLSILDNRQVEYAIGMDPTTFLPTVLPMAQPIDSGDFSQVTVVSPIKDARFRDGAMLYDEVITIDVHGHQNRNENRWLWAIVAWGLHRFRPFMISTFGLDLGAPQSSDLEVDATFQGTNVWVRRIQMPCKALWTWRGVRLQDFIGLLAAVNGTRASG